MQVTNNSNRDIQGALLGIYLIDLFEKKNRQNTIKMGLCTPNNTIFVDGNSIDLVDPFASEERSCEEQRIDYQERKRN